MKLLPKKQDIDKQKSIERKAEVDSGVKLAQSIDKLRATKLAEEKQFREWRETSVKTIQQEIDDLLEVKENLRKTVAESETYRKKLIEPLDKEWAEVNQAKKKVGEEQFTLQLSREIIDTQFKDIKKEQDKLSEIIVRQKQNEQDTYKAKSEAISLKELAHKEYEMARVEHDIQTDRYEKSISELAERRREYEVALSVIAIRENEVKEKEVDIIKREQHLETQQKTLRVAREVIKQNG